MKNKIKKMLVSAILAVSTVSLVACTNVIVSTDSELGSRLPKGLSITQSINKNMSALEMYQAGVENYNAIEYVGSQHKAQILSKALAFEIVQSLNSVKIKDNGSYYLDSETFTLDGIKKVHFVDQATYTDGKFTVRSGNKFKVTDGIGKVVKWNPVETYDSLATALDKYPNDPTRMNMYIVNSDTVLNATSPIFDAKTDQYSFSLTLDPKTATVDYLKNMEYNTSNDPLTAGTPITFTGLRLDVVMWENGLVKSISVDEGYTMKVLGSTTSTSNIGTNYFTYDKNELRLSDQDQF